MLFGNLYENSYNIEHWVISSPIPVVTFKYDQYSILKDNKRLQRVYIFNESYVSPRVYPAKGILLLVSPDEIFVTVIRNIRESVWWNSQAHILIVNENVGSGCKMANSFLSILWSFNISNGIYLCEDDEQLYLYTFNPFGNIAPKFWHKVKFDGNDKYWTLFQYPMKKFHGLMVVNGKHLNRYLLEFEHFEYGIIVTSL